MIVSKLRKHLSIANTRLNQKKELAKIAKIQNKTLHTVIDALQQVKNSDFSDTDIEAFSRCEKIRTDLLADETVISYQIFDSDETALVKDICRKAASDKKWCRFLHLLSEKIDSPMVLEIGTNVGISGYYILEGIKNKTDSFFVSMEGLPQLCEIASGRFSAIVPVEKFDVKQGLFDATFPKVLEENNRFNLLFIDGNHQKEPTIYYFNELKKKLSTPAILVFDDINWSEGMKEAWHTIKNDKAVNYAIDLYRQGIVIIDDKETNTNVAFKLHLSY